MASRNRRRVNTSSAYGGRPAMPLEPYPTRRQSAPMQDGFPTGRSSNRAPDPFPVKRSGNPAPEPFPVNRPPKAQRPSGGAPAKKRKKKGGKPRHSPPPSENVQRRRLGRAEQRRRRRRRNIITVVVLLLLILAGGILSVTVLFKVKKFRVENLDKTTPANTGIYTEEAILGALSIPMEENMFQFSARQKEQEMAVLLPYLEVIRVRRSLPSTVVVQVEPAVESWCAQTDSGWLVLSQGLKIMRTADAPPELVPVIRGLAPKSAQPGLLFQLQAAAPEPILNSDGTVDTEALEAAQAAEEAKAAEHLESVRQLLGQLEEKGLARGVTLIDLTQPDEAYFVYENRIKILLGTFNNLDYKIGVVEKLLKNETGEYLSDSDRGVLDVSHQMEGEVVRIPFTPGDFSVEPVPAPPSPDEPPAPSPSAAPTDDSSTPPEESDTDAQQQAAA